MAKNKPEIQAEALLNLVLDEDSLKKQLGKALGTTIKEAASSAQLGDKLLSPKALEGIRKDLKKTFDGAARDLSDALNLVQSDGLKGVLDTTRRDTVKKFQRDLDDLLSGKGRAATRSLPALPQLGKEVADELRSALRVFGSDSLRSGSYREREPQINRAQRNVDQLGKVINELAGLPAVAAKDLQRIRSIVNDKDTGRYLKMQATERENLSKAGQALSLQTQNLERLASTLSKMGFGDAASEIKAANQARKALVGEFNKITSPASVEARARIERAAQVKVDGQQAKRDRQDLKNEIKRREAEQKAKGTYQTIFGPRRAGQPSLGVLATMDDSARVRGGYKPREDYRATTLAGIRQTNAAEAVALLREQEKTNTSQRRAEEAQRAAQAAYFEQQRKLSESQQQELSKYNDEIRKQGDRQLAMMSAARNQQAKQDDVELQRQLSQAGAINEAQQRSRVNYGRQTSSYGDAQRVLQMLGGFGGLSDDLDIGIVRGGLSTAYRQAQQRLGVANTVQGQDSPQYREALADLNRIRTERDQLANRIRDVRAERKAASGGGAGGQGGSGGGGGADGTERLLSQFGRYAIGYGGLYALLGVVTQLKSELIELDRAFYSIKAVTQASDREMRAISRSIREVALNTNFSSREIAGAAEILGQAGVAPADMDRVLASTAQFASATNSSLSVAADLLTTVRTVFKELDDSTIADQLTKAINLSKLTAEDLKTILSLTSQTAASYNVDLEQLLGAVTTLRNAGIKPSTVATGLRQAMLEVFNPDAATTKALAKRYNEIGEGEITGEQIRQRFFGFTNADNPLIAALGELRRLGFADEGQKTLQRGFDIRAFNAISALVQNFKELEAAESKITFGRAAVEGADIQLESLSATLENLGSSVVVLSEQLSKGLIRDLQNLAEGATNAIEALADLDLELKAKGEEGLGGIAGAGVAGGLAGALLGRGIKGRIAGAAVGAFGAGAAASAAQGASTDGEFDLGDAAEIGGIVAFVGGIVAGLARRLRVFGKVGEALKKVPGVDRITGAASSGDVGEKIGAIGSAVTVVGAVLFVLEKVLDLIPENEVEQLRSMAEAAGEKAAQAREKISKLEADLRQYDVNSADPDAGTFPATLQKFREGLANLNLRMDQAFGDLAQDKRAEVEALLDQYAEAPGSVRGSLLAQLEGLTGKNLDDKTIYEISQGQEQLVQVVQGMRESIARRLQLDVEAAAIARANGETLDADISARLEAAKQMGPQFDAIVGGYSDLDFTEQQRIMQEYTGKVYEILDTRPKLAAELKAAQIADLSAELAASLAAADNSAEIAILVSSIATGVQGIGLSVEERLQGILAGLNANDARITSRLAAIKEERAGLGTNVFGFRAGLSEADKAKDAELAAEAALLESQQKAGQVQVQLQLDAAAKAEADQRDARAKQTAQLRRTAAANVAEFQNNEDYQKALNNPQALTEMGLSALDQEFLRQNRGALTPGGDATALFQALDQVQQKDGKVVGSKEYQQFANIAKVFGANAERKSEEQKRRERDERNMVTSEQLASKTLAETAIKKADYGKNYALLTSDSADNPVRQLFAAQKALLTKELEQAKAEAADAEADGKNTVVDKKQKVVEAQAKLDTLDLEMEQELDKFRAKSKQAGEQAQRKADNEAKKQARIAVTQTGIEQRIVKQNFDEAIRTGDVEGFQAFSDQYIAVQEKLRTQLEEELKARGYTTSQILDEIKLREDLNKPLAEQVENVRKLADQLAQMRDLNYRDIGSGPNLGGKEQTAYLGADGFTREELAASGLRDIYLLRQRREEVVAQQNDPLFQKDAETVQKLNQEIEDLDTQIGETRAQLDDLTLDANGSIYKAFSPRQLLIELENSQFNYQQLGDNLRSGLVSALDAAGDALARLIVEGGSARDILKQIALDFATEELATLFKTNLREGAAGLIKGATGKDGGAGGATGVFDAVGRGLGNFFGFGTEGGAGQPGSAAAPGGGQSGAAGAIAEAIGVGSGVGTSTANMNVQAGVVNVVDGGGLEKVADTLGNTVPKAVGEGMQKESKGFFGTIASWFSGLFGGASTATGQVAPAGGGGGLSGMAGTISGWFGNGASGADIGKAANQYGPEVAKMGGGAPQVPAAGAAAKGGGWGGAASGASVGMGLGAMLGGAIDKKNGSRWGALLGALAGAYFGFGMAGGGRISKSGVVTGYGPRGVDSVPVSVKGTGQMGMLAPGEGVLNVNAMDALGPGWVDAANSGRLFRKAVGGVVDASYNATQRAQSSAAKSIAQTSQGTGGATEVNVKSVNVFDPSEIRSAFQNREGEDMFINIMKRRGALNK